MVLTNSSRTGANNGTNTMRTLDGAQILQATCLVLVIVISVILNISVSAVIWRNKHLRRRTTNIFIVNLAVSNTLVAVFIMPLSFRALVIQVWDYSRIFCSINGMFSMTFLVVSISTLCCISVDRYYAVVKPMKYKNIFTVRIARFMLAGSWLIAMLCASLPLLGWSEYAYHSGSDHCSPNWQKDCGFYIFMVITGLGIPVVILLFTYGMIFNAIRKHERRVSTWSALAPRASLRLPLSGPKDGRKATFSLANNTIEGNPGTLAELDVNAIRRRASVNLSTAASPCLSRRNTGYGDLLHIPGHVVVKKQSATLQLRALMQISARFRSRTAIPREYKIAKTGLMLFLVFFLSWGPYMAVNNCSSSYITPSWVYRLAMWLVYVSCLLNPIVYAFSSKHIRDAFTRGTLCKKRRTTVGLRRLSDGTSTNM